MTGERDVAVRIRGAGLSFRERPLWNGLNLDVAVGEFLAVLGPNGSGKTSLLRVLLGQQRLTRGSVRVAAGRSRVGYVPQQGTTEGSVAVRGVDLVGLGLDGHRWGVGLSGRAERKGRVDEAIEAVGATAFARAPLALLSGGERQRLRIAQALVGDPSVLLCDEPLLSLDLAHQAAVSELIDRRRREAGTAVLFVTHEINPILSYVDRLIYMVDGAFRVGTPDEVMNSATLSELYASDVQVVRVGGQIHVTGAACAVCEDEPHHVEARVS